MSMQWEKVVIGEPKHEFREGQLYRGKVPGGWMIVLFWHSGAGSAGGPSLSFYPDPDHLWDGSTLPSHEVHEVVHM